MKSLQPATVMTHSLATSTTTAEPHIESDIPYLGPDRNETLDAYLPPETFARPVPAVLLIHGGGWHGGDKARARELNIGHTLSAAGYAVFSINYLLNVREQDPASGQFRIVHHAWPQNLYDCKSALRYLRAESTRFGIDPERIAVMGGSAGGRLSQLLGATAGREEFKNHGLYTEQSDAVSCILSFYGDYDIRGSKLAFFSHLPPEEAAAKETEASAITYLDRHAPPVFITHGTADQIVPVERSRLLADHLKQLGVEHEYIEIEGAAHSYHLQPEQKDLRPAVLAFLEKHLGRPARLPGVFVLGASLTIQFGPYLEKELEGRFRYDRKRDSGGERAEDNLDIPQGASGGDSSMVLSYLQKRRLHDPIDADILLLSCGLHDIKTDPVTGQKQVPIDQFENNLREALKEAALMGLKVVWLRLTPFIEEIHNARSKSFHRFSADADAYNAIADQVMRESGTTVIDMNPLFESLLPQSLIDHIHCDHPARQTQARFIATELFRLFPTPTAS